MEWARYRGGGTEWFLYAEFIILFETSIRHIANTASSELFSVKDKEIERSGDKMSLYASQLSSVPREKICAIF